MSKMIDLTNQDFGYWHVITRVANNAQGRTRWLCQCTACGKEKEVDGAHLRSGRSTNCGCVRMEKMRQINIKHEEGKTYGWLYVNRMATAEETPENKIGAYWNCTCTKCGKQNVIVFGDYLRNGDTTSCGCQLSKNEGLISNMLDALGFTYKKQYEFNDLSSTGRQCDRLKFDFAIFNNDHLLYLIEYDGNQHFEYFYDSNYKGWNNKKNFEKTRSNDLLKNKYCFEHSIPLIRIPYDKTYDINDLKIETTHFLITPQNEKDYYLR